MLDLMKIIKEFSRGTLVRNTKNYYDYKNSENNM